MANVWLKSRVPGVTHRVRGLYVSRSSLTGDYAPIEHAGRVFRFSHAQRLLTSEGKSEEWLVFVDATRA